MEIIILLTLLLMIISLGRAFFQAEEIYPISEEQIDLRKGLAHRAVKFLMRDRYLLNTVTIHITQKATRSTLIQPQDLKFEG